MSNRFFYFKSCALLFCALLCTSAPFGVSASDPIKIGVGGSHTGELASYGIPSLRATELAADYMNARGGVLGREVVVIASDDQCKPELAPNAATNLLSQDVVGVIGMICSGATKSSLPIYTESKIISLSPSSTTPSLTLDGKAPYFFRTIGHDNIQGQLAANFIGSQMKAKKVAFLHDNGEYGKGYAETTRDKVKELYPEIDIVMFEAVTPGASDYSAAVRKLRRENADVVVWGGYHPELSKIVNNMADLDIEIPVVAPDSIKADTYLESAGEAGKNTYASAPSDTSDSPASKAVQAAYEKKFGVPMGVFADNAYAAAIALMTAINTAGTTDSDAVVKALKSTVVETPIGEISFDENGDATGIGMTMYKVENGAFVPTYSTE